MAPITILQPSRTGIGWETSEESFKAEAISELPNPCYAFLESGDYKPLDGRRELLLDHFGVPQFVANRTCFELNGFFGHKAFYDETSERKRIISCTTWFRYLCKMVRKVEKDPHEDGPEYSKGGKDYKWFEMTVFTRWDLPNKCQVLCVDVPFDLPAELQRALSGRAVPIDFEDPFAMLTELLDQMIVYSDISVWRLRDPVRQLEMARPHPGEVFAPIHELSRHSIHVAEVLEAAVEVMTEIQRCRSEVYENLPSNLGDTYKQQAREYAQFQISIVKNLKLRSDSNRARLADEINLAFNNLARQDNNFIKSITLLTMIFLPASFVSALFSTTFFSYGDNGWEVSGQLWIYWVTLVPSTIVILLLWHMSLVKDDGVLSALKESIKQSMKPWVRPRVRDEIKV